ncbi:hypothetical protein [Streptomyces griseosporeus]
MSLVAWGDVPTTMDPATAQEWLTAWTEVPSVEWTVAGMSGSGA